MFRVVRGAVARFYSADGFFLAAGLAFFFLTAIIPLLLLCVSTIGFVLSTEEAANEVVGQLARNFPVYKHEIRSVLLRIVETRRAAGIVGTITLVMFSTPLFSASRIILHRILRVHTQGGFFRNLAVDAGMVLLLGFLLFAVSLVTWVYQWVETLMLHSAGATGWWREATPLGLSLSLSAVLFYLAYRYVPRRRMRVGAALSGAILASVLWEVAKQLFRLYIRKVGVYDQIYGPLGVLVAFVMFVYYSAVVFVLGAAYAATRDARHR